MALKREVWNITILITLIMDPILIIKSIAEAVKNHGLLGWKTELIRKLPAKLMC